LQPTENNIENISQPSQELTCKTDGTSSAFRRLRNTSFKIPFATADSDSVSHYGRQYSAIGDNRLNSGESGKRARTLHIFNKNKANTAFHSKRHMFKLLYWLVPANQHITNAQWLKMQSLTLAELTSFEARFPLLYQSLQSASAMNMGACADFHRRQHRDTKIL
jgi:hypothetical protein